MRPYSTAPTLRPRLTGWQRRASRSTTRFCSNSICTPSRTSIITGQYPHVNGVTDLLGRILPPKQTLPILFRQAGYQTAMIGKWHLKVEPNFDYYKVLRQGKYYDTEFRVQGDKPWPKNLVTHKGETFLRCYYGLHPALVQDAVR